MPAAFVAAAIQFGPLEALAAAAAVGSLTGLVVALRILARVRRLERRLAETCRPPAHEPGPAAESRRRAGAFEQFLAEDPHRRDLPKRDQFAEFRRWRRERGLSWHSDA